MAGSGFYLAKFPVVLGGLAEQIDKRGHWGIERRRRGEVCNKREGTRRARGSVKTGVLLYRGETKAKMLSCKDRAFLPF